MKLIISSLLFVLATSVYAANPVLNPANSNPANGTTGVAIDTNITLDFDINVYNVSTSALIEIRNSSDNSLVEAFNASYAYSFTGSNGGIGAIGNGVFGNPPGSIQSNIITLDLGSDLAPGSYHILIPTGSSISDDSNHGDLVIPINNSATYTFTVGAAPAPAPVAVPLFGPFGYLLMAGLFGFFGVRRLKK